MSFIDNDDQGQQVDQDNLVTLKRSQIRQLEQKAAQADTAAAVARENVMLRAGVDFDSPVGQLFAKGYDGDLDPVKVKEASAAIPGALKAAAPQPAAGEATEPQTPATPAPQVTEEERQATAERAALAAGATPVPNAAQDIDPRQKALAEAKEAMSKGATEEDALGHYFSSVAKAAHDGDQRAIVK